VILAASFAALFARHSSWQAFTVFFCANEGVAENASPEKIRAEHKMSTDGLYISQLQLVPWVYSPTLGIEVASFIGSKIYDGITLIHFEAKCNVSGSGPNSNEISLSMISIHD
jgi:hypothetical protein